VILLDTHAWLWLCLEPRRLSAPASAAIRRAVSGGGLSLASISLWEVAMLLARGRITAQGTPEGWLAQMLDASGVTVREITPAIAALAAHFPEAFPGDPADRIIAATARANGVALVSRDARMRASPLVETIW
jgi:PIN domain nuclease of toxin-antitoxin system